MNARGRDRRVYLASHPVLFALLAVTRRRPALRIGRNVLVHDREAYRKALTKVPLDRTAEGTTGGAAGALAGRGALFDQHGDEHRDTRRGTADLLGAAGVARLRPIWTALLADRLQSLEKGEDVDLVPLTAEIAGATAAALLKVDVDPLTLAAAARKAAAAAARAHLPGPARHRAEKSAEAAAAHLLTLLTPTAPPAIPDPTRSAAALSPADEDAALHPAQRAETLDSARRDPTADPDRRGAALDSGRQGVAFDGGREDAALAAMLAVAAINTTVAAIPRAVAWACDAGLWEHAASPALAEELLRVTAPTPLLPRVAAAEAEVGGCPVRGGDRMLLIARHAAEAHRRDPCPEDPAPAQISQLVFGAGPHACPGARLARTQLEDVLAALAPSRPTVVRARADRRSALPGWRSLTVRATMRAPHGAPFAGASRVPHGAPSAGASRVPHEAPSAGASRVPGQRTGCPEAFPGTASAMPAAHRTDESREGHRPRPGNGGCADEPR